MEGIKANNSKIQTKTIALPIGTAVGLRSYEVDLESEFKTCRGYYVVRNQGADYLRFGIKDSTGKSILEASNIKHAIVETNVAIKDRFYKETPFEANGKKVKITVENFTVTTATQEIDVLFLLDNNE